MSKIPKLDGRDYDALLNEAKSLAKQYTPEWNFDENSSDFGVVFAKVFCHMLESTISRYNKTAYNCYLTFLNMLGTKLRTAASASGMIIVNIVKGTSGAYIDKHTPLFADADTEDGTVIYETVDVLSAIDTSIKSIYFTEPKTDFISQVYANSGADDEKVGPLRIFDNVFYKNLQNHEIYFKDDIIFNMSNTDIVFYFYNSLSAKRQQELPDIFSDTQNVTWEYYQNKKWEKADLTEKYEGGVRIKFKGTTEPLDLMGTHGRFIRCRFAKVPGNELDLTHIKYKSMSEKINADNLFFDESELSLTDFFPFGEQYNMYNSFFIGCEEAFTKKGAIVEVWADMQFVKVKLDMKNPNRKYKFMMSESDFSDLEPGDIEIQKIKWEYWNGSGWARLNTENEAEEFFKFEKNSEIKRILKFRCPGDAQSISVGSAESYFIRARIIKMSNQFDVFANYVTPYIHEIKIQYDYEGDGHLLQGVKVRSNLQEYDISLSDTSLSKIFKKYLCSSPAMYMCLEKPLVPGMVRLFIDIEDGVHRFNPPVKWEYLADNNKGSCEWKHIDVMDATEDFSHSETVTIIGKNDFKASTIFGQEGYFLRIINPDGKYSNRDEIAGRPIINDIRFNAVRVVQKDTREPEYFSVEQDEENKVCRLSSPNVSNVEVWVDEFGKISTAEQERFLKLPPEEVQQEYDELGRLEKLWIKWAPVPNLVAYSLYDRVYEVDYPKGTILFGNGKHGKIPPEQYNESIKVNYSICLGTKGNIEARQVNDFIESITHIESIENPSPIMGGVDMETINSAAKRMFGQISGGNRIVSLSDFESSICFNDRNIYKIKCLPHVDEDSRACIGITSIAVLPRRFMQGYEKFQGIKERIWRFIDDKAPASLSTSSRLRIFEVMYVETSVRVNVVINDFNSYQGVYKGIYSKIEEFLNPVSGNFSHKGWGIGEFPRKEFIYNYIKNVPNISWIKDINIFTKIVTSKGKKELAFERVKEYKFIVPVFGEPEINITVN